MIFEDIERDYHGYSPHREDDFSFLNRSARPAAAKVRKLIEQWAHQYPKKELPALKSSLRSQFHSTFFELFIHTLLKRLGCIVEIHPLLNNERSTRPDFVAVFPTGERVIIECVYPRDPSGYNESEQARLDALYDELNRLHSQNFSLDLIEVRGLNARQPSIRKLRNFIEAQLASLDVDELQLKVEQGYSHSMPSWVYKDGPFTLEFSVWPKSPERRRKAEPLIGVYPGESRWGGHGNLLRSKIAGKASKYGKIEDAFVVAVNTGFLLGSSVEDEMDALFGHERIFAKPENAIPNQGTGVWLGRGGPQYTRLSAVIFSRVFPWNVPTAPICMYHNPFAARPCSALPWQINQAIAAEGKMQWHNGPSIGSLFDLPPGWPGRLFSITGNNDTDNEEREELPG